MSKRATDLDTSKMNPAEPSAPPAADLPVQPVVPGDKADDFSNMPNMSLDEPEPAAAEKVVELAEVAEDEPEVLEEASSAVLTAELAEGSSVLSAVEAVLDGDEAEGSGSEPVEAELVPDSDVHSSDVVVAEEAPASEVIEAEELPESVSASDVFAAEFLSPHSAGSSVFVEKSSALKAELIDSAALAQAGPRSDVLAEAEQPKVPAHSQPMSDVFADEFLKDDTAGPGKQESSVVSGLAGRQSSAVEAVAVLDDLEEAAVVDQNENEDVLGHEPATSEPPSAVEEVEEAQSAVIAEEAASGVEVLEDEDVFTENPAAAAEVEQVEEAQSAVIAEEAVSGVEVLEDEDVFTEIPAAAAEVEQVEEAQSAVIGEEAVSGVEVLEDEDVFTEIPSAAAKVEQVEEVTSAAIAEEASSAVAVMDSEKVVAAEPAAAVADIEDVKEVPSAAPVLMENVVEAAPPAADAGIIAEIGISSASSSSQQITVAPAADLAEKQRMAQVELSPEPADQVAEPTSITAAVEPAKPDGPASEDQSQVEIRSDSALAEDEDAFSSPGADDSVNAEASAETSNEAIGSALAPEVDAQSADQELVSAETASAITGEEEAAKDVLDDEESVSAEPASAVAAIDEVDEDVLEDEEPVSAEPASAIAVVEDMEAGVLEDETFISTQPVSAISVLEAPSAVLADEEEPVITEASSAIQALSDDNLFAEEPVSAVAEAGPESAVLAAEEGVEEEEEAAPEPSSVIKILEDEDIFADAPSAVVQAEPEPADSVVWDDAEMEARKKSRLATDETIGLDLPDGAVKEPLVDETELMDPIDFAEDLPAPPAPAKKAKKKGKSVVDIWAEEELVEAALDPVSNMRDMKDLDEPLSVAEAVEEISEIEEEIAVADEEEIIEAAEEAAVEEEITDAVEEISDAVEEIAEAEEEIIAEEEIASLAEDSRLEGGDKGSAVQVKEEIAGDKGVGTLEKPVFERGTLARPGVPKESIKLGKPTQLIGEKDIIDVERGLAEADVDGATKQSPKKPAGAGEDWPGPKEGAKPDSWPAPKSGAVSKKDRGLLADEDAFLTNGDDDLLAKPAHGDRWRNAKKPGDRGVHISEEVVEAELNEEPAAKPARKDKAKAASDESGEVAVREQPEKPKYGRRWLGGMFLGWFLLASPAVAVWYFLPELAKKIPESPNAAVVEKKREVQPHELAITKQEHGDLQAIKKAKEEQDEFHKVFGDGKFIDADKNLDKAKLEKLLKDHVAEQEKLKLINKTLNVDPASGDTLARAKKIVDANADLNNKVNDLDGNLKNLDQKLKEADDKLTLVNKSLEAAKVKGEGVAGITELAEARDKLAAEREKIEADRDNLDMVVKAALQELADARALKAEAPTRTDLLDGIKAIRAKAENPIGMSLAYLVASMKDAGPNAAQFFGKAVENSALLAKLKFYQAREDLMLNPSEKMDLYLAILKDRRNKDAQELLTAQHQAKLLLDPEANSSPFIKAKAYYLDGLAYRNRHEFDESRKAMQAALAQADLARNDAGKKLTSEVKQALKELTDPLAYFLPRVETLQEAGRWQAALDELNLALKAIPGDARLLARRCMVRLEAARAETKLTAGKVPQDVQDAIRADAAMVAKDNSLAKVEAAFALGMLEEDLGNLKDAEDLYREALKLHQGPSGEVDRIRVALGRILQRERTPAGQAIPESSLKERGRGLEPAESAAVAAVSSAAEPSREQGADPFAEKCAPNFHPLSALLAAAVVAQVQFQDDEDPAVTKRINESIEIAKELIASDNPKIKGQGYIMMGLALAKKGRRTEGLRVYLDGLKLVFPGKETKDLVKLIEEYPIFQQPDATTRPDKSLADYHYGKGRQLYFDRKYPEAEAHLKKACAYFDMHAPYWYFLGLSQVAQDTRLKREAADFSFTKGGNFEARGYPTFAEVNISLERIQGPLRQQINRYRMGGIDLIK